MYLELSHLFNTGMFHVRNAKIRNDMKYNDTVHGDLKV